MHFIYLIFIFVSALLQLGECTDTTRELIRDDDDTFLSDCLKAHNKYRQHHGSDNLKLDDEAVSHAIKSVKNMARGGRPGMDASSSGKIFGENYYHFWDVGGYHGCEDAVNEWYKGERHYNYNKHGFHPKSGGFSQLVWKSTKSLGCARMKFFRDSMYNTMIVCKYFPAGNVDLEYERNVFPTKRRPERPEKPEDPGNVYPEDSENPGNVGGGRPRPPNRPGSRPRPLTSVNPLKSDVLLPVV